MLGPDDLVFCSGTLLRAGFRAKVGAAAAGGFRGLSLWLSDLADARAEGLSDADVRTLLADHGLEVAELDALLTWLPGSGPSPDLPAAQREFLGARLERFLEVASTIGGRSINLAQFGPSVEPEVVTRCFADVCDRAAGHGLLVSLEFLPWSDVRDAATALRVVKDAGRRNGGIMFDTWHHFRSGAGAEEIRALDGAAIVGIQVNDAPATPEPDLVAAAMSSRLVPGEGDMPLVDWIRALDAIGSRAPIGVEVFSDRHDHASPAELGKRLGDTTRSLLLRARG